jgi:hypothetical protein
MHKMLSTKKDVQFAHVVDGPGCLKEPVQQTVWKCFGSGGNLVRAHRLISESVPLKINCRVLLWAEKAEAGLGPACLVAAVTVLSPSGT